MKKLIPLFILLFTIPAQAVETKATKDNNTNNIAVLSKKQNTNYIEGVGYIPFSNVAIRKEPNIHSAVIKYSYVAEKVVLLGEVNDEWYKVEVGNGRTGYILKRYIKTNKIFNNEAYTANNLNKKSYIEIEAIINRFNRAMQNSAYAKKYQNHPMLILKNIERRVDRVHSIDSVNLTLLFMCTDEKNNPIPTYKKNDFKNEMQTLLELLYSKLIITELDAYNIIINVPTFDNVGNVNGEKEYAVLSLSSQDVDMTKVKKSNNHFLSKASSSIKKEDIFKNFPK